jgi:hypothetical protein
LARQNLPKAVEVCSRFPSYRDVQTLLNQKVKFSAYGGLHTIIAAMEMHKKWKANQLQLTRPDPRWQKFPARIMLFPKKEAVYKSFLRQLGDEDNRSLKFVRVFLTQILSIGYTIC